MCALKIVIPLIFTVCVLDHCTCIHGGFVRIVKQVCRMGAAVVERVLFPFPACATPTWVALVQAGKPAQEQAGARQGFTRRPAPGPRAFQDDNQLYLSQLVKCIFSSVYQLYFPTASRRRPDVS